MQDITTDELLRRLQEHEAERDALPDYGHWYAPRTNEMWSHLTEEIETIRAELFRRGHATGGPRRE